jgi:hypothetical protein
VNVTKPKKALLTRRDFHEEYGIPESSQRKQTDLPVYRVGRRIYYRRSDIEAWLETKRQGSPNNLCDLVDEVIRKVRAKKHESD